jgi:type I restriction enzyme M protein
LIRAIVDCVQPRPGEVIMDPACGAGGFLLAAHEYLSGQYKLNRDQKRHLRFDALRGVELVDGVSRPCAMNLFLHGIGPDDDDREPPIATDDSLRNEPKDHAKVVVTNPPFGKKSSITVVNDEGETVRRKLLSECDVHTLLRLPTGIFYAQGVKANVLFFDRKPGAKAPWTKTLWVYDLRTNRHFILKTQRLARADLDEFVACYRPGERQKRAATWSEKNPDGRWRPYTYDEIIQRDKVSLDLFWLRDESLEDSANLPEPGILAQEIADDLRAALEQIEDMIGDLNGRAANNKIMR